ncbi:MAG: NAD-dependent epimerase/dehydratase family protein, partial [bacterium]
MKRRVLITGGSGFLGGYLVQLATKDFEVYATYHKNPVGFEEVQWRQLDLRNALEVKNLLGEIRPEAIIHNAAAADIDF